ncbi:MAG: hypothetical protein OXL40_14285 [Bacteroidota bacterium]|nr:hypothetical protein [Bacteroidota bacterium]
MVKPAKRVILLCALLFPVAALQGQDAPTKELLDWHRLPDLPDPIGVGGPCAGISNGALIVAGGAHFRDPFLQGGEKVWTDSIYVLTSSFSEWISGFTLTRPTGYTVAAQWEDEVICAGGGDARKHFKEVIALHWDGDSVSQRSFPALPQPRAFASGAVVETTLYVAGGLETPDDTVASRNFWALNLADPGAQWQILEPAPGAPRHSAVSGASDGAFYLFSGTALEPDTAGAIAYEFLTDAYRYHPSHGWERLRDLPYPAAAAPSPAIAVGPSHFLVLGGNTGVDVARVQELGDQHPGFSRDVLAYHVITDTWAHLGTLPMGQVTVPTVQQGGRVIIPSGEIRPGVRTAAVWQATPSNAVPPLSALLPSAPDNDSLRVFGAAFQRSCATLRQPLIRAPPTRTHGSSDLSSCTCPIRSHRLQPLPGHPADGLAEHLLYSIGRHGSRDLVRCDASNCALGRGVIKSDNPGIEH